jgi:uridine monophosphate synthetase
VSAGGPQGFFSRLERRARELDSLLCVGLDPHPQDLPATDADAARDFCLELMRQTADVALAYKPNAAFFEALGGPGVEALRQVLAAAPQGALMILDAKRGDIASSAEAYARAAFETLGAHALTVSPYLGGDSLEPFLKDPQRGVFLLCKTSNPGSADLQDLPLAGSGQPLYLELAQRARRWHQRHPNLGLVVGATHPEALSRVRAAAPDLWLLAPGVGAQGADLEAALSAGLRRDGLGLLVPVSRGIARAASPGQAARRLRDEINAARARVLSGGRAAAAAAFPAALADGLLSAGCVRFGRFTLKSGLESPIYLDLRNLVGQPELLARAADALADLLRGLSFERLAGVPYAGLPIATAVGLRGGWPVIYPRKEVKDYGTRSPVEGPYEAGERAVVLDDLATTGGSKFEAIDRLKQQGLSVEHVVVLVDRQSGAAEGLAEVGCRLHAVFTLTALLDHWERTGRVPAERIAEVRAFLAATAPGS